MKDEGVTMSSSRYTPEPVQSLTAVQGSKFNVQRLRSVQRLKEGQARLDVSTFRQFPKRRNDGRYLVP